MSAAEVFAERVVLVAVPLIVVMGVLIVVAVVGLVVEQRRKWPHGWRRVCSHPGCACQRSFAARLRRKGPLL